MNIVWQVLHKLTPSEWRWPPLVRSFPLSVDTTCGLLPSNPSNIGKAIGCLSNHIYIYMCMSYMYNIWHIHICHISLVLWLYICILYTHTQFWAEQTRVRYEIVGWVPCLAGSEELSCHVDRGPVRGPHGRGLWVASRSWEQHAGNRQQENRDLSATVGWSWILPTNTWTWKRSLGAREGCSPAGTLIVALCDPEQRIQLNLA